MHTGLASYSCMCCLVLCTRPALLRALELAGSMTPTRWQSALHALCCPLAFMQSLAHPTSRSSRRLMRAVYFICRAGPAMQVREVRAQQVADDRD